MRYRGRGIANFSAMVRGDGDVSVRKLSSNDVSVSVQGVPGARLYPCQKLVVS
jgi:hypothetical protein